MTSKESSLLEKMRDELHEYHSEVRQLVAEFNTCRQDVDIVKLDLYGNPEDRETNPGVLSHISDLRRSRRLMRYGLRGLWAIVMLVLGAAVTYFAGLI